MRKRTGPGRAGWARRRLTNVLRPRVEVTPAPAMRIEHDVAVQVRDGTTLRLNVFRPLHDDPVPVVMSAHPYGKDKVPAVTRSGRGVSFQYRLFPQPQPVRFSDRTSWEAPDPAFWVSHGYAVVNADLRGGGASDGVDDLLSDQEAQDYADLIEWVAAQPWCTGKVGLDGVSYLAISQYRVAALRPPHLAAICPWEGFTDVYRDFAYPGGVREDGFSIVWGNLTAHAARVASNPRTEFRTRPQIDDWYRAHTPDLERIEVPMLVCASFSDHLLHSRGSFEAFRRAGSTRKWLYTHRDGKWSHYYSASATQERRRFFDHVLKEEDNGWDRRPAARIAVHEAGPELVEVLMADTWPPTSGMRRQQLHLAEGRRLVEEPAAREWSTAFDLRRGAVHWDWQVSEDLDVIGPMALTVHVSATGTDDPLLFARVRKLRGSREVTFEGSYGYALDGVSVGWQRVAHRELDDARSTPTQPVHRHERAEPLAPGEVVPVQVALLPHATRFRAGEVLRLELTGRWPVPRDPLRGQLPAGYRRSPGGTLTVHGGPGHVSGLLLDVRPLATDSADAR